MTKWKMYILLCNQKTFYTGITDNINRRIEEHKKGYSPYTKQFSDIQLVHQEEFDKRFQAEYREQQVKRWTFAKKKALIEGNINLLQKLSKGI